MRRRIALISLIIFLLASSLAVGIAAAYTDDNTGEAYILETDRQVYHGLTEATIYLNITNTQASDVLRVVSHFPKDSGAFVKEFSELKDASHLRREYEYGSCFRSITGIDNSTGRPFSRNETYTCIKGYKEVEVSTKDWVPAGLRKKPHTSQRIPSEFAASEAAEGLSIGPGERKQYRLIISFPIDSAGEFWIEAEGAKGHGLLDPFWASDWKFHRQINVTNNAGQTLKTGFTVNLTFDHSSLVNASKSDAYGNDIRIDYILSNGSHIQLDRINTTAFNTTSTVIWFKTVSDIPASGKDVNYSLYYGNPNAGAPPANQSAIWNPPADSNTLLLYRFNEGSGTTVIDEKGNYNATWAGIVNYSSAYKKYGAYSVGPNFSFYDYVYRSGLYQPIGTVEAWIYPTEAPPDPRYHCAFESGIYMTSHDIGICINPQTKVYVMQVGTGTLNASLNQWTHVAVTWNGSVIKLYVNGQYDTSWNSSRVMNSNSTIYVGRAAENTVAGYPVHWRGYIDELRISNVVNTSFPYAISPEPTLSLGDEQTAIYFDNYQISPSAGAPNATFNFSVNVSNPYHEDTNVTLYVMNQTYDIVTSVSESLSNGTGVVTKGIQLNQSGIYFYHWYASSSNVTGRGPTTGEMIGPTVATGNYTITRGVWGSATRLVWRVSYSTITSDGKVSFLTLQVADPSGKEYAEFSSGVDTLTITVGDVNVTLPGINYNLTRHTELKRIAVTNPSAGAWTLRALHGEGLTSFETQVKVD